MTPGALTYEQAVGRLGDAMRFGVHPSLDGIRALTDALGRPQDTFKCIQVTGTNGKTSVVRMAGALLSMAGRRTGVYTSPHLISYTERIEVDGVQASEQELAEALTGVYRAADSIGGTFTEFELLTAAALLHFRSRGVEWAVLEVGMGGRWDATSVVEPQVAAITGVALDHTDRLGVTREEIAADKAHVIKPGSIAIIGPGCEGVTGIVEARAEQMGSPIVAHVGFGPDADVTWRIVRRPRTPQGPLTLDVDVRAARTYRVTVQAPAYQAPNVAMAMTVVGAALLEVGPQELVAEALKAVAFPGRFELLRREPPLVIDGAHNPDAAAVLANAIGEAFGEAPPVLVLAVLSDKDAEGIVRELGPAVKSFVVTENGSPRCMPAQDLAVIVEQVTGSAPRVEPDLRRAIARAEDLGDGVVVTGSLYTAGAVRALFVR